MELKDAPCGAASLQARLFLFPPRSGYYKQGSRIAWSIARVLGTRDRGFESLLPYQYNESNCYMDTSGFTGGEHYKIGPLWWDFVESGDGYDVFYNNDREKTKTFICHVKNKKDAEVISNAPALLEMVINLVHWVEFWEEAKGISCGSITIPQCKAVIARATGVKPKPEDVSMSAIFNRTFKAVERKLKDIENK